MIFIVEWHHEHGDYESAKRKPESAGLQLAKTGLNEGNRRVDCFIRAD